MSQFEFVSVGLALVYSFATARLLAAVPWVFRSERRYWVHMVWFGVVMLALVATWWQVWSFRDVEWNGIRFLWALSIPSLIYLRAGALISQQPEAQTSWREYYFAARGPFFGVGIAILVNSGLMPWVMGVVPWFERAPVHGGMAVLLGFYTIALMSTRPALHGGFGVLNFLLLVALLARSTYTDVQPF